MELTLDSLKVTVIAEDSVPYESPLWGQHGISLLVEAEKEGLTKRIMVDVGQNFEALSHNMQILGIDPATIDALVLTHCHYDHTMGAAKLVEATGKKNFPVIAHPEIFRPHFINAPFLQHVGIMAGDEREEIEAKGGMLFLTSEPFQIMPGLITSGEIPRNTDFEDAGISLFTIYGDTLMPDPVLDDISLLANVKDRGIVIITGCSHAGIVNITEHALSLFPDEAVEGIIGGFHLVEASEEKISKTVDALGEIGPGWISSGHCTGFKAQVKLLEAFGERFEPLSSGKTFEI